MKNVTLASPRIHTTKGVMAIGKTGCGDDPFGADGIFDSSGSLARFILFPPEQAGEVHDLLVCRCQERVAAGEVPAVGSGNEEIGSPEESVP